MKSFQICRQLGFHTLNDHTLNDHTHELEWLMPLNAPIHFIHTSGTRFVVVKFHSQQHCLIKCMVTPSVLYDDTLVNKM